ncbi:MAG: GYF domain-containing protein [Pseudomonadota bacterium]
MRAEAVSWDDWSTSNATPVQDADKWHVALAPDEVKVVSLEQLDDLFRLSIVDAETKVWQEGMTEWLPLRVIAGIEDDAPPAQPKRSRPKPPSPRSAPPPPRPATRAPVAPAPVYAQPVAPAPVYAQPLAFAQTQNAFVAPVAPRITSVQPLVVNHAPRQAATGGGGFGRLLVGLALLAGVSVTLYRNDVLRDAAHSLHQDRLYARLQESLGGPSFGTLASLEQSGTVSRLSAALPAALPAATATIAEPAALAAPRHEPSPAPANTESPPVVALESLRQENATGAKAALAAARPDAVAKPAAPTKPQIQAAAPTPVFKAAVAKAEPAPKAPSASKALTAQKAAAPKNDADMSPRERLNAAIGASVTASPAAGKNNKAKAASEYDPLNPKL